MGFASGRKFNINWILLNSNSNDLASFSTCVSQPIPIEANRTTPTEAELCLLICSSFPMDFRLPIEDLVTYGMALNLFGDVHHISERRYRVYGLINNINHQLPPRYVNKLCVWEDKHGNQYVKMFDSATNLAKSIALKYQLVIGGNEIVTGKWPNTNRYEYFYGLSHVRERIEERPITSGKIQHGEDSKSTGVDIFEGIKGLMIQSSGISSLLESLNVLCSLRTLRLNILKLEDMSWIGCLMNLEFLFISTASLTDIPKEMGQLCNLRLLDLRRMSIAYIPPGVLSRMLKLEELYFPLSFQRWGCRAIELDYDEWDSWEEDDCDDKEKIGAAKRINASISEITAPLLHALEISIPDASVLPNNSSMFKNIRRFKVFVPNNLRYKPPGNFYPKNVLQLTGDANDIKGSGICNLMSRTEDLSLMKVRNLKNAMPQLQDHGFPKLQKMIISECDELEYVVDTPTEGTEPEVNCSFSKLETLHLSMLPNLKEIWHGRLSSLQWFENLSRISIRFCHKLKYVFPVSIVGGSIHLKSIEILDCSEMDGIFCQDKEDDKDLGLYSIEELHLHSLPKLDVFLLHADEIIFGFHNDTAQSQTSNEVLSSSMEGSICTFDKNFRSRVNESCIDDEEVICPPPITISRGNSQENVPHQLVSNQLASYTKNNDAIGCTEKYAAFILSNLAEKWMQDLKILEIAFCDALQIIFLFEENHVISGAFNSLIELKLFGLQSLEHIWFQVPLEMIAFQNLQLLVLSECHNSYLFSPRVAKFLVQLRKIYVSQCDMMEEVILKENEEELEDGIVFPHLQLLEFEYMPNLKVFYNGIHELEFPLLESLKINQCNKVEYFSFKLSRTPMLKRIEINGSLCASTGDLNTTIMRYTRLCFGTPADDDNRDELDGSNELHCTSDELNRSHELHYSTSVDDSNVNRYSTSVDDSIELHYSTFVDDSNELHCSTSADDSNALHNSPHSDNESDGYDELEWMDEIEELPDSTTTTPSEANRSCMKEFTLADLKIATNNFSSESLLGEGGFGYVYKGWLDERTFSPSETPTGMPVAIKKLKPHSKQGFHEWRSELYVLERLCHPNLIKLVGCCREDGEFILVYEFMQKGSLDNLLLRKNLEIESLSWESRLKIAIGAARGLVFLHTLENKVIHRDIKSSNILLDENYNSRIADFGLAMLGLSDGGSNETAMGCKAGVSDFGWARSVTSDRSYRSTAIKGTFGYLDPEYARTCHITVKSDVYSFGVVLLQLLTSLKAMDVNRPDKQRNLVTWLRPILSQERELKDMMDSTMEGQYSSKAMLRMARLASKCTEDVSKRRPTMRKVLKKLQQIHAISKKDDLLDC